MGRCIAATVADVSEFPKLEARRRMSPAERKKVGAALLRRYNAGESIRQLCAASGYSIGRVRGLLEDAGVVYRPTAGGRRNVTS